MAERTGADRFAFTHRGLPDHAPADCRAYYVSAAGVSIGYVEAKRTESWRETATGVRYSLRGRPKHWEACRFGGARVAGRFRTRLAAAEALAATTE